MYKFLLFLMLSSNTIFSQIIYVDNFDGVYPYPSVTTQYFFDINNDQVNDIKLQMTQFGALGNSTCAGTTGVPRLASFQGFNNTIGQNKVNGPNSAIVVGIDCTNDTLNAFDLWNNTSNIYYGFYPEQQLCYGFGIGNHKQGFRLILTNPANGALGYKYGYINYSITSPGDIIVHGWYYENTFNVPIAANSLLDYPYDGNCIHYDTVTVYDTITTNITIYDTITTNINVYDTVLVSVTDTLIINTSLGLPAPNNSNTISVYPNPANDHITIDNGNFALMPNYSIVIENSLGQIVFSSLINQQQFYLDIMGWAGNGMYYLKLLNPQNSIVTTRKIVLE